MMKAVIKVGGKQYIVAEEQTLLVDKLADDVKTLDVEPLLVMDGDTVKVGAPTVKGAKVSATVVEPVVAGDKLKIIRFKAKKRVHTVTGHRQKYSQIQISKIA
jgi:large subunit ribosomal protein L21